MFDPSLCASPRCCVLRLLGCAFGLPASRRGVQRDFGGAACCRVKSPTWRGSLARVPNRAPRGVFLPRAAELARCARSDSPRPLHEYPTCHARRWRSFGAARTRGFVRGRASDRPRPHAKPDVWGIPERGEDCPSPQGEFRSPWKEYPAQPAVQRAGLPLEQPPSPLTAPDKPR